MTCRNAVPIPNKGETMNKKLKRLFDNLEEAIKPPRRKKRMQNIRTLIAEIKAEFEKPWWKRVLKWLRN